MKRTKPTLLQTLEAATILRTVKRNTSLYRLAEHVLNPTANPNPYGRRVAR